MCYPYDKMKSLIEQYNSMVGKPFWTLGPHSQIKKVSRPDKNTN